MMLHQLYWCRAAVDKYFQVSHLNNKRTIFVKGIRKWLDNNVRVVTIDLEALHHTYLIHIDLSCLQVMIGVATGTECVPVQGGSIQVSHG